MSLKGDLACEARGLRTGIQLGVSEQYYAFAGEEEEKKSSLKIIPKLLESRLKLNLYATGCLSLNIISFHLNCY